MARLLAIPLLAAGSAMAALPLRRLPRVLALLAAAVAWIGWWWLLPVAALGLVAADRVAGDLQAGPGRRAQRPLAVASPSFAGTTTGAHLRIALRALGWRFPAMWLIPAAVVVPVVLFVLNNDLTAAQELTALRFACVLAVVFASASVAESLSTRRPPWPWLRSLPWPTGTRVLGDTLLMGLVCAPALIPAFSRWWSAIPVVVVTPYILLRAAHGVRKAPGKQSGASGQVLAEGAIAAMAVAVFPWSAAVAVLLIPPAFRWAVRAEQRQDVSSWHELHHLAAGDPVAWSDT